MEQRVLSRKYVVDALYKYLTSKQKRMFDLYYLYGRDNLKAARMYIQEYKMKETRVNEKVIKRNYRLYPILRLAIEINDLGFEGVDEKDLENPTLEWTLSENMKLYKHADKEFKKYDELVIEYEGHDNKDLDVLGQLSDLRDKYKKEMKELLKQITDFQNKFGEMLNDDSVKIGLLTDEKLIGELEVYTKEAEEFIKKEKWYKRNKVKDVA